MRSLPEFILDAIATKLATVDVPDYRNTFATIEKDVRTSSESELADGPIVFVCFAGEQLQNFGGGSQVNDLEWSIEAHSIAATDRQIHGLSLIADIKKALLADKTYLHGIAIKENTVATGAEIRTNDQDDTVIAVVTIRTPYLERHTQIYYEEP